MLSKFHLKKLIYNQIPSINSIGRRFFSSASKSKEGVSASQSESLSSRFHQIYLTELDKLEKSSNSLVEARYKVKLNSVPNEAYVHPYHSEKFPVYWSTINFANYIHEAAGPEPVSPHFESFAMSRRAPLMLLGLVWAFNIVDSLNFTTVYGQHATYQIYSLIAFSICTFEVRYISQRVPAPRITWFYDAYIDHEYAQIVTNWQDKLEETARQFLTIAKEQIDFFNIHKEYIFIKKRSLSNYIETEKKNLDKHFYDRSVLMLKNIKRLEDSNVNNKIREVTEESLKVVLRKLEDPVTRQQIQRQSFESALEGLRSGKMTYSNDPILPLLVEEIKTRTSELKQLTPEQENKLFALSADQKKQVIELDHRAKIDFLSQTPNVASPSVKNSEVYRNIIGRMKRRIEANFSGK